MINRVISGKDNSNFANYAEFLCDLESDVVNLPTNTGHNSCSIGSYAIVLENKNIYILGSDGWVLFGNASGSIGSPGIATVDELKTYLSM